VIEFPSTHVRPDLIARAVARLKAGAILAIATDTTWSFVCDPTHREAVQRLAEARSVSSPDHRGEKDRTMSILCSSVSEAARYAMVEQQQFRLIRRLLPGPYTVILRSSRELPRLLQNKRSTVGIRIPDHPLAVALVSELGRPVLATTARTREGELVAAGTQVLDDWDSYVDVMIDSDPIVPRPSTVVDFTGDVPVLVRAGAGEVEPDWERAPVASSGPSPQETSTTRRRHR
jgi:tRNA threonylcarbamoyl adenosine modification protein (Sua5/YciO/YrdC/YwlC family)